jgi:hypothetical protein
MEQTESGSHEDKAQHIDAWLYTEELDRRLAVDFRGKLLKYWLNYREITFSDPQLSDPLSGFDLYIQYAIREHPAGEITRVKVIDGPGFRKYWRQGWQPTSCIEDGKGQRLLGWSFPSVRAKDLMLGGWKKPATYDG